MAANRRAVLDKVAPLIETRWLLRKAASSVCTDAHGEEHTERQRHPAHLGSFAPGSAMLLWACRAPPPELPREPAEPQRVLSFVSWPALVDFPDNLPLNSIPARKWASFG